MKIKKLIEAFEQAGQGHVFTFWEELNEAQKKHLLDQAYQIDLNLLSKLLKEREHDPKNIQWETVEPAPYIPHPDRGGDPSLWKAAIRVGEEAIRAGRVAAFTVAGGQGTRLGYNGPKGIFPATPLKKKPIFRVFAEKIHAAQRRYQVPFHWFIMTGLENHEETIAFFEDHGFFGLEHVHFFRQGVFPAVDFSGKLILADKHSIALSPDGHGGALKALVVSGATQKMKVLGIDIISFFQVDNPLVKVIDPAFIGFHLNAASEMSSKMVTKRYAEERVGVFCSKNKKLNIIEYSDLPEAQAKSLDEKGQLAFRCGNVAIHILNREFVERLGANQNVFSLPYHWAKKKVFCIDDSGFPIAPEYPNAIKFELFIFDALAFAKNPIVIESDRSQEFSPIKNSQGVDSVQTCYEDQLRLFAQWAQASGVPIPVDDSGLPEFLFEVSPLFANDGDEFLEQFNNLASKPDIQEGTYLE